MRPTPRSAKRRRKKQTDSDKLEDALVSANLDDRLVDYWNRHKNQVVLLLWLALATIAGIQGAKWWSAKSLSLRADAYAAATTDLEKEAFADNNARHNIGGTAYLELADKAYAEGEFSKAGPLYEKAYKALDLILLKQRSHLGLALANLQAGSKEEAVQLLQSAANNGDYLDVAKAEALFHLSVIEWKDANFSAMLSYQDQIEELSNPGLWQSKAQALQRTIAGLKELVEARLNEGETAP